MRTRFIAGATIALATAGLATACSTTSSASHPGASAHATAGPVAASPVTIETLYGQVTGSAAASQLNSNSNAPLKFPVFYYNGVVKLTVAPFALPGGPGASGTDTLPGGLRVHHVSSQPAAVSNGTAPPPAAWTYSGGQCHYIATFDKGTYTVVPGSTGKFAGAAGHGAYQITAVGSAPAKSRSDCSFTSKNLGPTSSSGASITFTASGPLTITKATSASRAVTGEVPV